MTALAGVSRATFYRFDAEVTPAVRDVDLRDAIQRIALQFPAYGRPRITAELKRQGWQVNHKRVGRILREDNLLCLRKRKFQITTDSRHGFRVYPNLTRKCVPSTRNQLWVADITYIRLADEFVYLAVVLAAYSRLVIGWAVERTLEAKLAVGALQLALDKRGAPAGLIHHSDRGVQGRFNRSSQRLQIEALQWVQLNMVAVVEACARSWNGRTTRSGCIRHWATGPRRNSMALRKT
jgi:transposase InsO family protein